MEALDSMYNVWTLMDRARAVVEGYAYDEYGRPHIRESAGRGDCDNDTNMHSTDGSRVDDVVALVPTDGRQFRREWQFSQSGCLQSGRRRLAAA